MRSRAPDDRGLPERNVALVVLDLNRPNSVGPEIRALVQAAAPQARVGILTVFDDEAVLRACLTAGATAMVVKDGRDVDLMAVPRRVWGGQTDVDEWIDLEPLTQGEHAILRLLARGMTSKEIGTELGLATNSARTYAQSLLSKLNAKNRIQALAIAQRLRLV